MTSHNHGSAKAEDHSNCDHHGGLAAFHFRLWIGALSELASNNRYRGLFKEPTLPVTTTYRQV